MRGARAGLTGLSLVALATAPAVAMAGPSGGPVTVESVALLGAGPTSVTPGWNEVLVRIQNGGHEPVRGRIEVETQLFGHDAHEFRTTASFAVGAEATIYERVPAEMTGLGDVTVTVTASSGEDLGTTHLSPAQPRGPTLIEVADPPRLTAVLHDVAVSPTYVASGSGGRGTPSPLLTMVAARFDPKTGDPMLPEHAASYANADAVLIRSDALGRLAGAELEALGGFVLGGGTLAVVVVRPEDLRSPTLMSFAGGVPTRRAVAPETLAVLVLPAAPAGGMAAAPKSVPVAHDPKGEVAETLAGYAGGNLHPSIYGSSAAYGLGEVHLLAFDPTRKPAVDDPWAEGRMVDLARRAYDRRSTQIFRPGSETNHGNQARVRRQLDPNESSRWAIAASVILLCAYAAVAGPISFALASRSQKPLRALRRLPAFAALAFLAVVGIGVVAKGVTGRARHLSLVEAGAGMSKGIVRRFRGFYASRLRELTVRAEGETSVVSTAIGVEVGERRDHLVVDRDGARLVDVAALPWQTLVVREDGAVSLGDGIALVAEEGGGVTVVNRSGHALRAAVVRNAAGAGFFFPQIADDARESTTKATAMSASPEGRAWEINVSSAYKLGAIAMHRLDAENLGPILEDAAPGLGAAWSALEEAGGSGGGDWFPDGVPTLIGQLDGGEGKTVDSGLRLESDRLLVRVVGYGGAP